MSKHIFLMFCLNRFRSNFQKIYNFYATVWRYFAGEFFDLKNLINRQSNGDLEPLKGFGIITFLTVTVLFLFTFFNLILDAPRTFIEKTHFLICRVYLRTMCVGGSPM
jgi:hypothetical protein